jgi:hypothetical protein
MGEEVIEGGPPNAPAAGVVAASPKTEGERLYLFARLRKSSSSLPWYFVRTLSTSPNFDGFICW